MSEKAKEFFEAIAEEFDAYYTEKEMSLVSKAIHRLLRKTGMMKRFSHTLTLIGNCEGKSILDVGCGSGRYLVALAKRGALVTGIDFAPKMIQLAIENMRAANVEDRCRFIVGDFINWHPPGKYHVTLAIGVFDYLERGERKAFLTKLREITLEKIIITFPKKYAMQTPLRKIWLKYRKCPVFFYPKSEVTRLTEGISSSTIFLDSGPIWTTMLTPRKAA